MRTILSIAFIGLLGTSAFAADAIIQRDDPIPAAPPVAAPAASYDWSGIYLGVDGGFGRGNAKANGDKISPQGAFGGLFAGYNFQVDNWVIGVEGDAQFSGIHKTERFEFASVDGEYAYKTKWTGTARVRAGYAIDRFLPYVTGGLAVGEHEVSARFGDKSGKISKTQAGYALGAGLDYAITDNLIGKVEYQFMDFGKKSYGVGESAADVSTQAHTVRVGLSYKF